MRGRGAAREVANGTKAVTEVIATAAKAMVARERVMLEVEGIRYNGFCKELDCIEAPRGGRDLEEIKPAFCCLKGL